MTSPGCAVSVPCPCMYQKVCQDRATAVQERDAACVATSQLETEPVTLREQYKQPQKQLLEAGRPTAEARYKVHSRSIGMKQPKSTGVSLGPLGPAPAIIGDPVRFLASWLME